MRISRTILVGAITIAATATAFAQSRVDRAFTATGTSCDQVEWSQEALEDYPQIASACQEVLERNGRYFVLFEGEVERVADRGRQITVRRGRPPDIDASGEPVDLHRWPAEVGKGPAPRRPAELLRSAGSARRHLLRRRSRHRGRPGGGDQPAGAGRARRRRRLRARADVAGNGKRAASAGNGRTAAHRAGCGADPPSPDAGLMRAACAPRRRGARAVRGQRQQRAWLARGTLPGRHGAGARRRVHAVDDQADRSGSARRADKRWMSIGLLMK